VVEKVKIMVDSVTHKCGHTMSADMFRNQKCAACIRTNKIERGRRKLEKRQMPALDMGGVKPGRLPDDTVKTLRWVGGEWQGMMTVPGCEREPFITNANTDKKCLHALHDLYAAWLAVQPKPDDVPAG
jgi:hypothetical protein